MTEPADFIKRELWDVICGELLGMGSSRCVYAHLLDPHLVVKAESPGGSFQNVAEWQVWKAVEHTEFAKWFAPCVAISPCGSILIQRRTTRAQAYPDKIPNFLTDTKLDNYGILTPRAGEKHSQFVVHDYGVNLLSEYGLTKRMRKANWWNL